MKRFVVDASVVIKCFVPEVHSIEALRLLNGDSELLAPELLFAEFGNVLWKKWRRGELEAENVRGIMGDLHRINIQVHDSVPLCDDAWNIAESFNRSFYDSLYVALAYSQGCPVVTADLRLYNALKDGPLKKAVLWVEDIPHV